MRPGKDRNQQAGIGVTEDEETPKPTGGKTVSTAPNASFETGAGEGATGFDSPAIASVPLSNPEVRDVDVEHLDPYYPPGGADKPVSGDETG